jgi:hypothetical protein
MAIRRVLSISEVAEAPFRSLVDVDEYLAQLQQRIRDLDALERHYEQQFARVVQAGHLFHHQVRAAEFIFKINRDVKKEEDPISPKFYGNKFDKISIPDITKLTQNFALVNEQTDILDALKTLYNTTLIKFKGVKGQTQTLLNVKMMHKDAATKRNRALEFLASVGDKYAPDKFKKLVKATMDYIQTGIEYKSSQSYLYCHTNKEKQLQFTYYVHLSGLKTDDGIEPSFFLIFTCILVPLSTKEVIPKLYVNILKEFEPPSKFPLGKHVIDFKSAALAIGTMMTMEHLTNSIGTLPHNIDIESVKKAHFSMRRKIANISGDDHSIQFEWLESVKEANVLELTKTLANEVKTLATKTGSSRMTPKIFQEQGRWITRFTWANNDKPELHALDFLKDDFKLSDNQMQQIRKTVFTG